MTRYLIVTKRTGRLGNRLTVSAHCLAAARERGWILLNPSLEHYAEYFMGPRADAFRCKDPRQDATPSLALTRNLAYTGGRLIWQASKLLELVPGVPVVTSRALRSEYRDLRPVIIDAEQRRSRLLALRGYHFRHHPWARRHADAIRAYFEPIPAIRAEAEAAVAAVRARADVLVGVHIRHGDYAEHLDGRFFYSIPTYLRLMRECQKLLEPQRTAFIILSNAAHEADEFSEFDASPGPGGLVSDLHVMSLCDRIVGPPSSYSSWAAFYGEVPIARVQQPDRALTPADFAMLRSPDPLY